MNVLVINCGSSSLKFQLIDGNTEAVQGKGLCERIGIDGSRLVFTGRSKEKIVIEQPMPDHTTAIKLVLDALVDKQHGVIESLKEINAIGHRVVHGGERFSTSVVLDDEAIKQIEACNELAPLHNPANLIGINVCKELMPGTPMVAVFDTSFHQTMPEKAYLYGLPYHCYTDYKIRKYGFHGTSHAYVSKQVSTILEKPYDALKTIVCHLGNGASLCAVENGQSVDTSMGFTPVAGLVMGTRCGDIDPAIMEYLAEKENVGISEIMNMLNKESGIYGLSGGVVDFRDLKAGADEGKEECIRALNVFVYNVATRVGAYAAAMGGVDAIAFTAGIGENAHDIRKAVCEYLPFLGIELNDEENENGSDDRIITTDASKTKVLVVATNEELMIARETMSLV